MYSAHESDNGLPLSYIWTMVAKSTRSKIKKTNRIKCNNKYETNCIYLPLRYFSIHLPVSYLYASYIPIRYPLYIYMYIYIYIYIAIYVSKPIFIYDIYLPNDL